MKPQKPSLPRTLQLTGDEIHELANLARTASSSLQFWARAFLARGIACPASKVLMMAPTTTHGEYRLEWHAKRLGPKAIAVGAGYIGNKWERQATRH